MVISHGCPDLANVVEQKRGRARRHSALIDAEMHRRAWTDWSVDEQIQCCVLGCTHYPLVEDNIHRLYPGPAACWTRPEQMAKDAVAPIWTPGRLA